MEQKLAAAVDMLKRTSVPSDERVFGSILRHDMAMSIRFDLHPYICCHLWGNNWAV